MGAVLQGAVSSLGIDACRWHHAMAVVGVLDFPPQGQVLWRTTSGRYLFVFMVGRLLP